VDGSACQWAWRRTLCHDDLSLEFIEFIESIGTIESVESMERIELRAYRPEDLQAIAALDNVCFEAPFRFSRAAMKRFVEARNALNRLAWAVDEDSENAILAGFCVVHVERGRREGLLGYVVTLDIAPPYRRCGLAHRLMRSLEAMAARAGAGEMFLHVAAENHGAIRLYERLGYHPVRREKGFYGEGGDAMAYRRALEIAGEV